MGDSFLVVRSSAQPRRGAPRALYAAACDHTRGTVVAVAHIIIALAPRAVRCESQGAPRSFLLRTSERQMSQPAAQNSERSQLNHCCERSSRFSSLYRAYQSVQGC